MHAKQNLYSRLCGLVTWYLLVELKGISAILGDLFLISLTDPQHISIHLNNAASEASPATSLCEFRENHGSHHITYLQYIVKGKKCNRTSQYATSSFILEVTLFQNVKLLDTDNKSCVDTKQHKLLGFTVDLHKTFTVKAAEGL